MKSFQVDFIPSLLFRKRLQVFVAHLLDLLPEKYLDSLVFSDLLWRFKRAIQIVRGHGHLLVLVEKVVVRPFFINYLR